MFAPSRWNHTPYTNHLTPSTNSLKTASTAAEIFATVGKGKDVKFFTDVQKDLKDLPAVLQASADQSDNLFARFDRTHFGAFDALRDAGKQLSEMASTDLPSAQHAFSLLAQETDGSQKELWRLLNTMPDYKDALTAQATAQGLNVTTDDAALNKKRLLKIAQEQATVSTQTAADTYQEAADNASDLDDELSKLIETINKANGVGQDAVTSNANYQDSLAKVQDTIQKAKDGVDGYSTSLDEGTAAGADNASMFADLAQKSQDAAKAQFDVDHNTQNYTASLQAGRQTLYNNILGLTGNADAAQALTDKIYAMPSQKEIDILADTSAAQSNIDRFINTNDGRVIHTLIRVDGNLGAFVPGLGNVAEADGGVVDFYAGGGIREDHRAQIARAGDMRVWAEPETGGEAYIPLGISKRKQAIPVMQETARRLGGTFVPDGASYFADGGSDGGRSSGRRAPVINVYPSAGMDERAFARKVAKVVKGL